MTDAVIDSDTDDVANVVNDDGRDIFLLRQPLRHAEDEEGEEGKGYQDEYDENDTWL